MTASRRIALGLWLGLTVGLGVVYFVNPALIDPATLVRALRQAGPLVLVGYALLSVLRPLTLVPSTVLIVVGTLLFPDRYWLVFAVSLAGVVTSSTLVYFFFDYLGLAEAVRTQARGAGPLARSAGAGQGVLDRGRVVGLSVRADRRHLLRRGHAAYAPGQVHARRHPRRDPDCRVLRRWWDLVVFLTLRRPSPASWGTYPARHDP